MAIFKSTLFNKIHKSMGNLTFYESCGQNVVRNKKDGSKKKVPGRLAQEARMATVSNIAAYMIDIIKVGYPDHARLSSFNQFIANNIGLMEVDEELQVSYDLKCVQFSSGELLPPKVRGVIDRGKQVVTFVQERQPLLPFAPDEDQVYGLIWGQEDMYALLIPLNRRCEPGEKTVALYQDLLTASLQVYAFTVNTKKKKASTTIWLTGE